MMWTDCRICAEIFINSSNNETESKICAQFYHVKFQKTIDFHGKIKKNVKYDVFDTRKHVFHHIKLKRESADDKIYLIYNYLHLVQKNDILCRTH